MKTITYLLALYVTFLTGCYKQPPGKDKPSRTEDCQPFKKDEFNTLFEKWNNFLEKKDHTSIVKLYAENSVLLPTRKSGPLISVPAKVDYFKHFMEKGPSGKIKDAYYIIGCNYAVTTGLYTFTLTSTREIIEARYTFTYAWDPEKSEWLITSHHSSELPKK